ncbi:DUF1194 domain-containing protein [Pseudooceanicola sp. LIPI14-2-Ac024]|uniref:DUF1194 domain-containing protein n=1 Tax=Pseudooceanicola sp. LIPI14-2-Ac024 TaxID=3344875 RepID=UPI0035CEFB0E
MSPRALVAATLLSLAGGAAAADCRVALALALDVSGSVNFMEYRLQLDGVASSLSDPEVIEALTNVPGSHVALSVYEWSGPNYQRVLVDWTMLDGPAGVAAIAARLRGTERLSADPSTAIGGSLAFGSRLMAAAPPCFRRVIDISGDGKSNTGPHPRDVEVPGDVMVNALVIGGEIIDPAENRAVGLPELTAYFKSYVIRGPEAFTEVARGFFDFEAAMVRKLKRELTVLAVSEAPAPPSLPRPAAALPASLRR